MMEETLGRDLKRHMRLSGMGTSKGEFVINGDNVGRIATHSADNIGKIKENSMKKRSVTLIVISSIVILIAVAALLIFYFIFGGSLPVKTTNIEDYPKRLEQRIYSDLKIFPQEIPKSATDVDYYYYFQEMIFDPSAQIYLHCKYSKEDFQKEVERLATIREEYRERSSTTEYASDNFNGEVYIYNCDYSGFHEYAIVDSETCEINYIFFQFLRTQKVHFDKKYLPVDF